MRGSSRCLWHWASYMSGGARETFTTETRRHGENRKQVLQNFFRRVDLSKMRAEATRLHPLPHSSAERLSQMPELQKVHHLLVVPLKMSPEATILHPPPQSSAVRRGIKVAQPVRAGKA